MSLARVVELRAYHVRIPLRKTITHASHSRNASENLVVACLLDDGTMGFGEGVPRDYVTGETIATGLGLLRQTDWHGQLSVPRTLRQAVTMVRQFELAAAPADERRCVGNAARCAAELALLDAFGRHFGVPLARMTAELADWAEIHETQPFCRYSAALTSKASWREALSACKLRPYGFRHCKIKVGTAGQDDVRRLRRFRRILGRRMDLRVDANEAWTPTDVVARIAELEPFGISAVEQPLPHQHVASLAEVRRHIKTPIIHDESLCSMIDAERAVAEQTCDMFNIRLSKCGGFLRSLDLAAFAHRCGLGYQLGCQVGESGILSAAGRHFACSVKNLRYVEGSYDKFLVRERLTVENLTFGWFGKAPALVGPGLGITVNPRGLAGVTVAEEQVFG
jgi:muconate cycloisomerase